MGSRWQDRSKVMPTHPTKEPFDVGGIGGNSVGFSKAPSGSWNGGTKFDGGKSRTDLIPPEPLMGAGEVFAFGARKYGDRNWEQGISVCRLYGALLRHLLAWLGGEQLDPESGLPHTSHAMCCMLMLHAIDHRIAAGHLSPDLDDRKALGEPA